MTKRGGWRHQSGDQSVLNIIIYISRSKRQLSQKFRNCVNWPILQIKLEKVKKWDLLLGVLKNPRSTKLFVCRNTVKPRVSATSVIRSPVNMLCKYFLRPIKEHPLYIYEQYTLGERVRTVQSLAERAIFHKFFKPFSLDQAWKSIHFFGGASVTSSLSL